MAFTMHSHSGQFCPGHAKDNLEEIIQTAIAKKFRSISLTEHMPRNSELDLYPEETTIEPLAARHEDFLAHALTLREKYSSRIKILIGFEGEWIRPDYAPLIHSLAANPAVDYFIGSVHHVHGIPIDYDAAFYSKAIAASSDASEDGLFRDYYDSQLAMLEALKPRVVGHFDLIKLLAKEPDRDPRERQGVWEKMERNLKVVVEQGGLLEVNSSALRKGLGEPYPGRVIVQKFLELGGKLTLSDDSHGIVQVGACFEGVVSFLEKIGVQDLWGLERGEKGVDTVRVGLDTINESLGINKVVGSVASNV